MCCVYIDMILFHISCRLHVFDFYFFFLSKNAAFRILLPVSIWPKLKCISHTIIDDNIRNTHIQHISNERYYSFSINLSAKMCRLKCYLYYNNISMILCFPIDSLLWRLTTFAYKFCLYVHHTIRHFLFFDSQINW